MRQKNNNYSFSIKHSSLRILITIDGPAGAGKTTVSHALADRLGYKYIDTGALYRGVAYEAQCNKVDANDDNVLRKICKNIKLNFVQTDNGLHLFSENLDINDYIRTPEISMLASEISAKPFVRECLLELQRRLGKEKCAVFEGRDMGTVVFPDADINFFLDASTDVRALRRHANISKDSTQTIEEVKSDIIKRDKNDISRTLAPLKPSKNAIVIDSSVMSIEAVVELMLSYIDALLKSSQERMAK